MKSYLETVRVVPGTAKSYFRNREGNLKEFVPVPVSVTAGNLKPQLPIILKRDPAIPIVFI